MDYTDLDTVKTYGGFTSLDDEHEALLQHFLSAASAMIDDYCDRIFGIEEGAATTTKTLTKDNGMLVTVNRLLYLPDDLCSTPTIATLVGAPTLTYIPDSTPYWAISREDGAWEDPTTIAGHWAYSMTPPVIIQNTAARLAIWLYHQTEAVQGQGDTVNTPNLWPRDIRDMLRSYKRVRLP